MRGIKRKFKYLVAKTLLFIIFTGGFFSCQNNNEQITLDNNKKFVVRAIQKKEIKENHILVNRIDKINQQNNGLKGGNHEIKLNKEYATYLESVDGTYHSYTFKIDNQNRNNFDIHNLVLSLSKNNQYKAYLVKYSLTKEERESIDRGSYLSLIDKVTIEPFDIEQISLNRHAGTCMELVLVGTEDCHCHTTHAADGCTHPEEIYQWQSVPCNSGGGSSSSGTSSGGTNNTGAGGGSIGGSNTNENGVATSLTNTDGSLTETQNLINQINGILTGNDSFKINTNLNTLAQFNSVSDFSSFLNNFNNTFSISGYELTNNQNGTKTTKFKGQFTNSMILPVYLNVHVTSKLDDPNTNQNEFSLESVNSFKTGSMPFTNWVQDSYFYNYSGSYTTVTINGHFDFGISIGNLHLTYTESWIVKVFFNNITGNAINMTVTKE